MSDTLKAIPAINAFVGYRRWKRQQDTTRQRDRKSYNEKRQSKLIRRN